MSFFSIAALNVTFFLAVKKKVTIESSRLRLPLLSGSAATSSVVAEPDDAGLGGQRRVCAFSSIWVSLLLSLRGTKQSRCCTQLLGWNAGSSNWFKSYCSALKQSRK